MSEAPVARYRSPDEDSARWVGFPFRQGDIVISARSKSGTTWVQMICALLVFQTSKLPAPLAQLSPWLDWLVVPRAEVLARLAAQKHRRFIKTHTPLDGIPLDSRALYIVVARHPLDLAVSLYHQGNNLDRERIRTLTGQREATTALHPPPPLREWLLDWIDREADPQEQLDSLPGVMGHLSDAWGRRGQHNVALVHYEDLSADLEGQMRHLAAQLGITVAEEKWTELAHAARFEEMRAHASELVPDQSGVLRDHAHFFRRGSSGAGRELLSSDEMTHYLARTEAMAPPGLLTWLHHADH